MSIWIVLAGLAAGLGVFGVVREVLPGSSRLDAALARLDAAGTAGAELPGDGPASRRAARRLGAAAPWLPVPDADLAMLGQDREAWIASKIVCGAAGLAVVPFFTALMLLGGVRLPLAWPAAASLAFGAAMFFAPDLVTKVNAAERRADFRHALTSYLDLVALERGPAPRRPRRWKPRPESAAAGHSSGSAPRSTRRARPALPRGPGSRPWPARPASASWPTWLTSPASPGRKGPGSSRR